MILISFIFTLISTLRYLCDIFIYLCSYDLIFIKIFFICISLYILFKYVLFKKYKLSTIRKQKYQVYSRYKINDENDLDISICILFLYVMFFIIGIFMLRIKNMIRFLNLNDYFTKIHASISLLNFFDLLLNIIIIIIFLILYLVIFSFFAKKMKYNFLKVYYYFFINNYTKHTLIMLNLRSYLNLDYYITHFTTSYLPKKLKNYPKLDYFLFIHIYGLRYIIHRIVLLFMIFYDLFFNNMMLSHMFKIMPIIFIYEIWCRLSIFLTGLNFEYDKVIAILLYGEVNELDYDSECLYLNDVPYEKKLLKEILMSYARNDSVDKFYLPQNPINQGIKDILTYWKNLIKKYILNLSNKYYEK